MDWGGLASVACKMRPTKRSVLAMMRTLKTSGSRVNIYYYSCKEGMAVEPGPARRGPRGVLEFYKGLSSSAKCVQGRGETGEAKEAGSGKGALSEKKS